MSDNITPIFEQGQEPQKPSLRKQWIVFIAIVALIFTLLIWFLLSKSTSLDGLKRFFRYLGKDNNAYSSVYFEAYGSGDYALVNDALAVASQGGVTMFSQSGRTLQTVTDSFSNPMFDTAEELLLLYDVGGTRLMLLDSDGKIRFNLTTDGMIFDADVCEDGLCAVVYEGRDCRTVLDIYNSKGAKLYTHRSSSAFLNTCALSPDGAYAVVTTLGQEDISFLSTARIFATDAEGIKAEFSFGTQVVCDIQFADDEKICAIGEASVFFFDAEGNLICEYTQENALIADYCFGEDDLLVLYDHFDATIGYELQRLTHSGKKTDSTRLAAAPQDLDVCGNYVGLIIEDRVLIYDSSLTLRHSTQNEAYLHVLTRSDGTAICVGSNSAELYIP